MKRSKDVIWRFEMGSQVKVGYMQVQCSQVLEVNQNLLHFDPFHSNLF